MRSSGQCKEIGGHWRQRFLLPWWFLCPQAFSAPPSLRHELQELLHQQHRLFLCVLREKFFVNILTALKAHPTCLPGTLAARKKWHCVVSEVSEISEAWLLAGKALTSEVDQSGLVKSDLVARYSSLVKYSLFHAYLSTSICTALLLHYHFSLKAAKNEVGCNKKSNLQSCIIFGVDPFGRVVAIPRI